MESPDTVVLEIRGRLTIGPDAELRDSIDRALEGGARTVILAMERVTRLDSSGTGELAAAHVRARKLGARLLLVGLPPQVTTVLQVTQLHGILEIFETMDQAIATIDGAGA